MNKGVILKVNHKSATMLTEDCQMISVKRQPDMMLGQEYTLEKGLKMAVKKRNYLIPSLATAAVVVLLVVGLMLSGLLTSPVYATLSVDVNPSLELDLNQNLEVVQVRAMNEDAEQLMIREEYIGLGWREAVLKWAQTLRAQTQLQVENMLISAVMPEDAIQLQEQLVNMEQTANQGELNNIAVRVIYSNDEAVRKMAQDNDLSVGRQMLLNQSQYLHAGWDAESIADASLSDLVPTLLRKGERDQTRLTWQTTESLEDPNGNTNQSQATQAQGSQNQSQQASSESAQATHRETSGSAKMSGVDVENGNMSTDASTVRETLQESSKVQATTCEPSSETCESSQSKQPLGSAA